MLSSRVSTAAATARTYSTAATNLKITASNAISNLSSISVVVNGGSKYGKAGLSHLLSKYAFLNTESKSALRFTRESELLGGSFKSTITRDSIILNTQFLKEDLPYFVNILGDVLSKTSFRPHEFNELVLPAAQIEYQLSASNSFKALEALHELSFRKNLGQPLYYDKTVPSSLEDITEFASKAFTLSNLEIVTSGVEHADLSKFIAESSFSELQLGTKLSVNVKSFTGFESRVRASGDSVAVIGIPVTVAEFGKYELLSTLLGSATLPSSTNILGQLPNVEASSELLKYTDAGLFTISVKSSNASAVSDAIKKVISTLNAATDLSSAKKATELSLALQGRSDIGLKDTTFKFGKFNLSTIGNVDALPFIDEL